MSTTVERSIEIDQPVRTVYDQWTQFEDLKLFVDGIEKVHQVDERTLEVTVKFRGVERTWTSRIVEQVPDMRIAWESADDDPKHAGVVTFHHIDEGRSRIMMQFDFWPEGLLEQYADKVGLVESYTERVLEDFKSFIEERGSATGSWRGTIERPAA